jgi:hypothetical protein
MSVNDVQSGRASTDHELGAQAPWPACDACGDRPSALIVLIDIRLDGHCSITLKNALIQAAQFDPPLP